MAMDDVSAMWGGDIVLGPTGDVAMASAPDRIRQRILRRLLTAAGGYVWQLPYGAGLGRFVGAAVDPRHVRAIVEGQLRLESIVAVDPPPVVKVTRATPAGDAMALDITYWEADSGNARSLSLPLEG